MWLVIVHNASETLPGLGYDLNLGADVDRLNVELRGMIPELRDWSYDNTDLQLNVPADTPLPEELSKFGTVEVINLGG